MQFKWCLSKNFELTLNLNLIWFSPFSIGVVLKLIKTFAWPVLWQQEIYGQMDIKNRVYKYLTRDIFSYNDFFHRVAQSIFRKNVMRLTPCNEINYFIPLKIAWSINLIFLWKLHSPLLVIYPLQISPHDQKNGTSVRQS